ncbi:hypothetical protein [Sporosarcina sp. HYO08]|uniref:hypothetical protein n=1 Tax=Sporosarcina sp. HYO08 TaxID=1759557 RepID=UPI000797D01E|nr:hypothetical protein [Sporosarcina sp. HYO08]KXH86723.1 hypothetical protein AU377_14385 [Sporosarcina sp. HYO08]
MDSIFKDRWNPTPEEIKKWAYSTEDIPDQDWELAINSFGNIPMICTFIEDENCIHTSFFLCALYVFTGDLVRSGSSDEIRRLSMLLEELTGNYQSDTLNDWIQRSKYLIRNPESYDYAYWGLGSKYVN